ncbi:uncharacterized protein LOC106164473 [Lingula anatina]|uniref:Uncharacterized protein LOC106164473 n=1 Tax=Lingula anatina TaxID=7574 RepID=A0A1S3IIA6_LINAN|nr:uncharacterized protein LOC106164473 [Lingula anatina]|eukprot:XP_013397858.1 uncharacterized protein LOC106164473 [Lingula anatina]
MRQYRFTVLSLVAVSLLISESCGVKAKEEEPTNPKDLVKPVRKSAIPELGEYFACKEEIDKEESLLDYSDKERDNFCLKRLQKLWFKIDPHLDDKNDTWLYGDGSDDKNETEAESHERERRQAGKPKAKGGKSKEPVNISNEDEEGSGDDTKEFIFKDANKNSTKPEKLPPFAELSKSAREWIESLGRAKIGPSSKSRPRRGATPYPPYDLPRATRKEYRLLTDSERKRFHAALHKMKTIYIEGISQYDIFTRLHLSCNAPANHQGPAFLPWHREFLRRFEIALRRIDPSVSLPYWDTTLDARLKGDPGNSILWADTFLGTEDGKVTRGPFKSWIGNTGFPLYRNIRSGVYGLMNDKIVDKILSGDYRYLAHISCPGSGSFLEVAHDDVHSWVGGNMEFLDTAPDDPLFYMFHAFIDFLWEGFRQKQKERKVDCELDYPMAFFGPWQHAPYMPMRPFWGMRNIDGCSDEYTETYYEYAPRPTCTAENPDCGSPYLYCRRPDYICVTTKRWDRSAPCRQNCGGFVGEKEQTNSYCLIDASGQYRCDEREWAYLPVKVIYSRPIMFPTYGDWYTKPVPRNFSVDPSRYANNSNDYVYPADNMSQANKTAKYCDIHCECCGGAAKITVQAMGLNYIGEYHDYAIVDSRQPIASATTFVAVRNPEYSGFSTYSYIRAYDACGNECYPACVLHYSPYFWGRPIDCSGVVRIDPIRNFLPLQYGRTYRDAAYLGYTTGIPYFGAGEECSVVFYCSGYPRVQKMPSYYVRFARTKKYSPPGMRNQWLPNPQGMPQMPFEYVNPYLQIQRNLGLMKKKRSTRSKK